ncbi:DUF6851 domain-containing protein [Roseovarius aestuariivivens]|uniref:DUF6851 domain-containing protein n=1 Tax=Roseovarius aestuariivivens TaxID=1888910 RepID=UPI00108074EB|nr:calcium-binding protein [Roseovarius aestuariivivens]
MQINSRLFPLLGSSSLQGAAFPIPKQFVFGTNFDDTLVVSNPIRLLNAKAGFDTVTLEDDAYRVILGKGDDTLLAEGWVGMLDAGNGDDDVTLMGDAGYVSLRNGNDLLMAEGFVGYLSAGGGNDVVTLKGGADEVDLGRGNDIFTADAFVYEVSAGNDNDNVTLNSGGGTVDLGLGNDVLSLDELVAYADGGLGTDELIFSFDAGALDIAVSNGTITLIERFSGQQMTADGFEQITFADRSFDIGELTEAFGPDAAPYIQVAGGTQAVTVNNIDPTISVIWDRVVQQSVIETSSPTGPTVASRAYAMMHTAIYDAWSAFDATATHVSLDLEGDNIETTGTDAQKEKAMSFAAITVLRALFPDMEPLFETVMAENLGFPLSDDGSLEAQIGIDAAEDLLAVRLVDGSNQAGGYTDTTGYTPFNSGPNQINDITRWTPENVPVDPEDNNPEQTFLTPHWLEVEGFALAENPDGETDFSNTLPPPPDAFFTAAFSDATLNFAAKSITLGSDATIGGVPYIAGDVIAVSKDLIGDVINQGFIDQAEEVVAYSANLTDEQKIIAEFWEDGGGTAFPPGTFISFAQFVSARDNHTIEQDAKLFLMMGNAVMDAGIATWQSKVEYDYARPVRAIRDLGELGLIGEMGVDELTGETGYVIEAFGGIAPDGTGYGTRTILAENFITFQLPGGNVSPPFAEYTSGHSGFSAAGAEVLRLVTGSDDFGGSVTFAPGSTIFEQGVPFEETTLAWDTFSDAADEAGLSRLYGGIHFTDGDLFGRQLGRTTGSDTYDLAQLFFDGTATDADRPFGLGDLPIG